MTTDALSHAAATLRNTGAAHIKALVFGRAE
jgi:hypothetical protein